MPKHEPTDYPWTRHGNRDGKFYAERNGEEIQITELGEPVPVAMSAERYVDAERIPREVQGFDIDQPDHLVDQSRPPYAFWLIVSALVLLLGVAVASGLSLFLG